MFCWVCRLPLGMQGSALEQSVAGVTVVLTLGQDGGEMSSPHPSHLSRSTSQSKVHISDCGMSSTPMQRLCRTLQNLTVSEATEHLPYN